MFSIIFILIFKPPFPVVNIYLSFYLLFVNSPLKMLAQLQRGSAGHQRRSAGYFRRSAGYFRRSAGYFRRSTGYFRRSAEHFRRSARHFRRSTGVEICIEG